MSEQAALLAAIIASPDDDVPRLVYADWLDENRPDPAPSPAAGPSARADYVRVQCRLAGRPFDEPDYAELLERERDLSDWLNTHAPDPAPPLPGDLEWFNEFDGGEWGTFARGFLDETEYTEYDDAPDENVARLLTALPEAFALTTVRSLRLADAYGEEVGGLLNSPVAAGLRGLALSDIADDNEADAVRAIATSAHLTGLRKLSLDFYVEEDDLRRLARADHLGSLESLSLDYPSPLGLRPLGAARWFRNLRVLQLWMDSRDALKAVAELPEMPNLVALSLRGAVAPAAAAVRKFAASGAFPLSLIHI